MWVRVELNVWLLHLALGKGGLPLCCPLLSWLSHTTAPRLREMGGHVCWFVKFLQGDNFSELLKAVTCHFLGLFGLTVES